MGLKLSLLLAWVLLTGTLATVSNEMDWLVRPALRVAPQSAPLANWGTLAANAQAAAAGGKVMSIHAPPHAWFAAEAIVEGANDTRFRVYLDPYDGSVRGVGAWRSFQRFFREMHRHLLLPAKYGIPIVTALSFLIISSLVSGVISYKKFWRGFWRRPKGRARQYTGDLHRLGGLWSLWFVALIGLTGLWYFIEVMGGNAPNLQAPKIASAAVATLDAASVDRFALTAKTAFPSLDVRELRLPQKPGQPIGFLGQADATLVRDRANAVWIDPADGTIVKVQHGNTLSAHQRISEMADPLHFGTWGGMATKLLWFVAGLLLTGLAVTGAVIHTLRLGGRPGTVSLDVSPFKRLWRGMGMLAWPAGALVLASVALIPAWLTS